MGSPNKLFVSACLLTMMQAAIAAPAAPGSDKGGIVKWVDEKGVTHYGDSIPPEYANRSNTMLNKSGRVLRKNEAFKPGAAPLSPDAEAERQLAEQKRRDNVLLASYTNVEEIDLARERSTQMDEAAIKGLEQRSTGVKERLAMHEKSAATIKARKKPIPEDLQQDIDQAKGELGRIDTQIAEKRKNIEATRVRFDQDKQRFHELKTNGGNTSLAVPPLPPARP